MSRKSAFRLMAMSGVVTLLVCITACKHKPKEIVQADPRFVAYISSYTSGIVSSASTVKVRLTEPSLSFAGENTPATEPLFDFNPSVDGKAFWIDRQTVEFRPSAPLKQDEVYSARFHLGKVKQVESSFNEFQFGFRVMPQSFEVIPEGLLIENTSQPDRYTYLGSVVTMDVLPAEKLKGLVSASYKGQSLELSWTSEEGGHRHNFRVPGIVRDGETNNLILTWSGSSIEVDQKGSLDVQVPATGFFGKLGYRVLNGNERGLYIYFSDPLDTRQDIRGLVSSNKDNLSSFIIQSNVLRVFFSESFGDELRLKVMAGLSNSQGKRLDEAFEIKEPAGSFASLNPQIKAVGEGSILPSSQGLIFPFEAVGLKAVRLTIIKVFENNIGQFLQENRIDGSYEMKRVGRPVFSKLIPLTNSGVADLSKWNRFTFDLNEFIQADPGALYHIIITFNRQMILQPCAKAGDTENLTEEEQYENLMKKFDGPGGYYYSGYEEDYDNEDYDWHERENPCNAAYYSNDKMISRNILATDIGLLMKRGNSGDILAVVSDIRSAKPMEGVTLELFDYQLQKLAEARSDGDGFATFKPGRKPFLLIAKSGNQRSYLRVDDGSSLSLSNFDVSGAEVEKGLKGFIYGERGVWRPGDTLFLSFILEDEQKQLPAGHPVVFELKNPNGQLITRIVKPLDNKGIYPFKAVTLPDAPTGKWTAVVKCGGAVFTKALRIETVKPNRLKIQFEVDKSVPFGKSGKIEAKLHARWLHGGTAGGLKSTYEVFLTRARAEFKSWKNYTFDDPGVDFHAETYPVFSGTLDTAGDARISANLKLSADLPSALNAYFRGKVFEQGGDFSVDFLTEPILPYPVYVGMRTVLPKDGRWLEADKQHTVMVATVDRNGQPVSVKELRVEIVKMDWSWWWEEENSGAAEYVTSGYRRPVLTTSASTSGGKGSFGFQINYPDWGRYYIRIIHPETGQSCGEYVYIDWPGSYGRTDSNIPGGATMLALSADKNACKVGESVKVTIPGAPGARALISLENGSRAVKAWWVDADKAENIISVVAAPEMTPNVFIHVTVIQPHKGKNNDLPIRQYGILPLSVEDPGTVLIPEIRMADVLKPEQTVSVTVSEKNGKPMTYTIAVVDEGLLDLTRFRTPDPHEAFFAPEALGVKTFDLYDDVIGAFGGTLERLLSIGGDEALKQDESGKNQRFKPVVRFLGPFTLGAGKKSTQSFVMPNYVGSVRTMVVAASNGAYGMAEKTTPVKQDLMAIATLPRVLGPGEELLMPVELFVMNPAVKTVNVTVKVNSLVTVEGGTSQTVEFGGTGDRTVFFKLKAKNATGNAKIEVTATSGSVRSTYPVDLPVRVSSMPASKTTDYTVNPGQTQVVSFLPFGIAGTGNATLEMSNVVQVNFTEHIRWLVQYPYGCGEQTTSTAFAQLYLPKIVTLTDEMKNRTEANVREGIRKLPKLQSSDGGFLYWPGTRTIDDWVSSYCGQFMLESMKQGYSVPDFVVNKWKEYQQSAASRWVSDPRATWTQLVQAYRLYTLALAGTPDMSSMNRLKEEKGLIPQAAWKLAAAYALAGKRETATAMTASLPLLFKPYTEMYYTYGSSLRDLAMVLETVTELGQASKANEVARSLTSQVNKADWLSTQETAFALSALAKYYDRFEKSNGIKALYVMNGQETRCETRLFLLSQPLKITEGKNNTLNVTNLGNTALFLRLTESGVPSYDQDMAYRNDLNMSVNFTGKDGKPIDVTRLPQGTEFRITVRLKASDELNDVKNLALSQMFPSGWEIANTRIGEGELPENMGNFTWQDFRDDRVDTFFDLEAGKQKTFVFTATATYAGKFYLPGTYCEAMYDHTISAKDKGMWVEVVR
jgi:alpha-2-macroglobulin